MLRRDRQSCTYWDAARVYTLHTCECHRQVNVFTPNCCWNSFTNLLVVLFFFLNLFGHLCRGFVWLLGALNTASRDLTVAQPVWAQLCSSYPSGVSGSHHKLLCVFMFHAYKLDSCLGVFAPTLFSKIFGSLVCESCSNILGNASAPFICNDCHYSTVGGFFFYSLMSHSMKFAE